MSRCDSAAIVPNTSELLPEPETPVNTVSRRFGSSTLTSRRLFTRAPCTRMRSWRSATGGGADGASVVVAMVMGLSVGGNGSPSSPAPPAAGLEARRRSAGSAQLLDADQVARRVAEGAVAHPVGLL